MNKEYRLATVASELNTSFIVIAEFLQSKGYKVPSRPTHKITEEMYNFCIAEFSLNPEKAKEAIKFSDKILNSANKIIKEKNIRDIKGNFTNNTQNEIWKKYILAQSKILEFKSNPIRIVYKNKLKFSESKIKLSVDQVIHKQVFKKEVEAVFDIDNFDMDSGFIQKNVSSNFNIKHDKLSKLKELADVCYINFNENPIIDGYINQQCNLDYIVKFIEKNINILIPIKRFQEEKSIYLTWAEKNLIDELKFINFNKKTKAKFKVVTRDENDNIFNILDELFNTLDKKNYRTSKKHCTISFTFQNKEEFKQKLKVIENIKSINIIDLGKDQKYKFTINYENRLIELQELLTKNYPNIETNLTENGEKLIFRQFYCSGNKTEILARLNYQLEEIIDSEKFFYKINDSFIEKYICEENLQQKKEQEEEKLRKLLFEEFYFSEPNKERSYLGRLQKVNYPNLYFEINEEKIDDLKKKFEKNKIISIFPDLKGEKDKIKRLEDTINKLHDNKINLPNNNAKEFLFDSSKAKKIENIGCLINRSSNEWQDFENNLFSKSLNQSQKQAIFKSLYAEELALIQGPPGTGKSTAIAEIIWQHIRKDPQQKILLTSETNLAVDNAIDRLKNNRSNIIKPIRFGNTENLDSEGYFYSLEAIQKWKMNESIENNAVAHWLNNIIRRISIENDEEISIELNKWKRYLQNPDDETKELFVDKYIEYVNLIGATGSSIGKFNSENKWTSFFRSYLSVFKQKSYKEKKIRECNQTNIEFDTIIMDEASKATPPELALPILFGKKSIIVGDHRQLPPMIDGSEIKDLLSNIGEKELAKTLSHKEFEISQFERLFNNIDISIKGTLDTQYRMHPSINEVIAQFYMKDGGLKCGLPTNETYHNSFDKWDSRYHGLQFGKFITPETHTIWLNVTSPEYKVGTSRVNYGEIDAIKNILKIIKNCNGKTEYDNWLKEKSQEEKQIGIISFYGQQIKQLEKMLLEHHHELYNGQHNEKEIQNSIRLSTVDRFQGMERNIIIVSMVRSNKLSTMGQAINFDIYPETGYPHQDSLGFAESPNRLNVALSRARRLLIVVGNSAHFCQKEIYKNVFDKIKKNGKIYSAEELQNLVEQSDLK